MRLIHTSDWHLGRSFHRVGLLDAQASYLDHLVEVVRTEGVDAVLVSGDVYDRALPSPDTVELLSYAVTRLIDAGAVVVLSSGNHDSAIRLGFASDLLARAGLHIRTSLDSVGMPVMIKDAAIYPLPYLEPSSSVQMLWLDGRPAGVQLPSSVEVAVAQTEPGVRGDTVSNVTKPATLQTGAVVQVPLFVNLGDRIKVDPREGRYISRA